MRGEVDDVLIALGGRSKYQFFQHLLIACSSMSACFQLLCMVFIGNRVSHRCAPPFNGSEMVLEGVVIPNTSIKYKQCSIDINYNISNTFIKESFSCIYGMEYSERRDSSFVAEFDLVCDRAALGDLPQTLLIIGQAVGALVLPYFSDRYGRKPVHIISHIAILVIGTGIAFSPNYIVFAVFRLLIGVVQQGLVLTRATYGVEIYPTTNRRFAGMFDGITWSIFAILMTGIGYLMRDQTWRHLQLVYTSAALFVIIQFIYMDESFRWLMRNRKYSKALKTIKKAASFNKVNEDLVVHKFNDVVAAYTTHYATSEEGNDLLLDDTDMKNPANVETSRFIDILKIKRFAKNTFIIWFMWCTAAMCYFGLFFTTTSLSGNPYFNVFLNSVMGIIPSVLLFLLVDRIGRKGTAIVFYLTGGICLLISTIIKTTTSSNSTVITILFLIGVFGAGGAFRTCFFYTPELFPTNLRNVGLGAASVAARVGGGIAPFSRLMSQHIPWGPGAIFGIFNIIATVLVTFLPETKGNQLPQTISEMKLIYPKKNSKRRRTEDIAD